jgi:hypothetical protein
MSPRNNRLPRAKWLRFTEEDNALDYLEKAAFFICQTESDRKAWKWVVLSLHSALYAFAICAIKGTNPDRVTYKTKKGKVLLIDFDEALTRCQDPKWMRLYVHSRPLILTDNQKWSINKLKKEFRNQFEHYQPLAWSIEIHGFPQIALDILDVIRFLAFESGNIIYSRHNIARKIRSHIFQSKKFLRSTVLYKESIIANRP